MRTSLTYTPAEWFALVAILNRPDTPTLIDPDVSTRINNAVGRSWLSGQRQATVDATTEDAAVLRAVRSRLPDAEVLAALAEADRIIREHRRRPASR